MKVKYFKCMHCGNIIEKITDKGVPVMCCGEPMKELIAGKTDAAVEKHVPVYTVAGVYRKHLKPEQKPAADFFLCDGEKAEEVYAYCNLHGLWKA